MRKFLLALALLLGVIFFITRFTEVQAIANTLQRGDWRYLGFALVVQLAWALNIGSSFFYIYQILGIREDRMSLLRQALAANFANVIAPSGGISGVSVLVAGARQKGYPPGKAAVAGALFVLFDYAAFFCVLLLGLTVLFRRNHLDWPEIAASIISVFIASSLAALLYLATRSASMLGKVLAWLARRINRILAPFTHNRSYLSEERAFSFATDMADGVRTMRTSPSALLLPFALAVSTKAMLISVLFLVFLAFKVPFSVGTIIAGFSIGYLFVIASPTPSGIGFVEGALTLFLNSMWVPLEDATIVTLAYRGITFWFPLILGMIAFRSLSSDKKAEKEVPARKQAPAVTEPPQTEPPAGGIN
jgi:uncharacterized protein (TIRG00374 family)